MFKEVGHFNEIACHRFLHQLLDGLAWLHQHGVAHRDLKCDNLLLSEDGDLKIGDFGSAKRILETSTGQDTMRTARAGIGSPFWMSPEIIRAEYSDDVWRKADIWGVGCVAIELLTGKPPWTALSNPMTVMYHIASTTNLPSFPEETSPELGDFIRCCLNRNSTERLSAMDLLYHPFITREAFEPWAKIEVVADSPPSDDEIEGEWSQPVEYNVEPMEGIPRLDLEAYYDPDSGWWYDPTTEQWCNLWEQSEEELPVAPLPWYTLDIIYMWLMMARESLDYYPIVRVLGNYAAGDDSELSLVENELLKVIESSDDGWWYGSNQDGSEGYFPCTYVEYLEEEVPFQVKVVESIDVHEASHLKLDQDETIRVLHRDASGWWFGENHNHQAGWFPSSYVEWTDIDHQDLMVCENLDDLDELMDYVGISHD